MSGGHGKRTASFNFSEPACFKALVDMVKELLLSNPVNRPVLGRCWKW